MSAPYNDFLTNSSTTLARRLSPSSRKFKSVTLVGVNAFVGGKGVANTGIVYLGFSPDQCPFPVQAGKDTSIVAPPGELFDLFDFWMIPATANDGLAIAVTA